MQEQGSDYDGDEEEDEGHEVWQKERELVEEPAVAEETGVLLGWLGEEATEAGTENRTYAPYEGHQSEGSRLEFLLGHHFSNHGSYYANCGIVLVVEISHLEAWSG